MIGIKNNQEENKSDSTNGKFSCVDLFCGIGGFSKGFEKVGFQILFGIDNWDVALRTFQKNHTNVEAINADLREIKDDFYKKYSNKVDVVIAGPPCQGFSMSGKRNINDKRNTLFEEVIRSVKLLKPKIVIVENVVGLVSMKTPEGELVKNIIYNKLNELGYSVESKVLNASEFGVPQARKRVIFIGSKIGKIGFPEPKKYKVTVGEALENIPDVKSKYYNDPKTEFQKTMTDGDKEIYNHDSMNHNEEVLRRIKHVPPGGNWRDIPKEYYNVGGEHSNNYRRLDPNKPSITIKHATKSMIIHPKFDRVITAREAARLQSFSDSFIIYGTKFQQQQQLANAVPPLLAQAIGEHILQKMNREIPKTDIQTNISDYNNEKFTFIDLFSGIGGFRIALQNVGGKCVFSSDVDKWANETYFQNFGEYPKGDIYEIFAEDIPDHDILCGGFPCQPFSIAGRRLGFADTRGNLFFEIERILKEKRPKAFILENVKGLINHNKGNTFATIKNSLIELGYNIYYKVLNSKDFGIPQNRERIFIIGFKGQKPDFRFPEKKTKSNALHLLYKNIKGHDISEIASKHIDKHLLNYKKRINENFPLFATEIRPSRCVFRNDGASPCLTAKMGTGGNNVPVLVNEKRKLSVKECLRLQGFPDNFKIKPNNSQSYKQIGNSVTVPLVELIAEEVVKYI